LTKDNKAQKTHNDKSNVDELYTISYFDFIRRLSEINVQYWV